MEKLNSKSGYGFSDGSDFNSTASLTFKAAQKRILRENAKVSSIQTAVTSAVEHLHDMSTRMSSGSVYNTFNLQDISQIQKLIQAINDLEKERIKIHELYETETIKSSKLRYKLMTFPRKAEQECQESLAATKASNAKRVNFLNQQLADTKLTIENFNKHVSEVEEENKQLVPKRQETQKKHESYITLLNEQMSSKAQATIHLNETKNQLKETTDLTICLEDEIIQLKDDLIEERKETRCQKQDLKQQIVYVTSQILQQEEENVQSQKSLEDLKQQCSELHTKVESTKMNIRCFSELYDALMKQEGEKHSELISVKEKNDSLREAGENILEEETLEDISFQELKTALAISTNEKKLKKAMVEQKYKIIEEKLTKLSEVFQSTCDEESTTTTQLDTSRNEFLELKEELDKKGEMVQKIQKEVAELDKVMQTKLNTHQSVISNLNTSIEELRSQLQRERVDRMKLQAKRDNISKQMTAFKEETEDLLMAVEKRVVDEKKEHVKLEHEASELQKMIEQDLPVVAKLNTKLAALEEKSQAVETEQTTEETDITSKLKSVEGTVMSTQSELKEKTEEFEVAESTYKDASEKFDKLKKNVVNVKTHKVYLTNTIAEHKKKKRDITSHIECVKMSLHDKQELYMDQTRKALTQTNELERDIVEIGCKIKRVTEENETLNEGIRKLEKHKQEVSNDICSTKEETQIMHDEYDELQRELWRGWQKDKELQELMSADHSKFLNNFGDVINETGGRVKQIDSITVRLEEEVKMLAEFLENVRQRRPDVAGNVKDCVESRLSTLQPLCVSVS